jgi:hypothetical protein
MEARGLFAALRATLPGRTALNDLVAVTVPHAAPPRIASLSAGAALLLFLYRSDHSYRRQGGAFFAVWIMRYTLGRCYPRLAHFTDVGVE